MAVKVSETRAELQTSNELISSLHLDHAVCHCMHVDGTACLQMLCNIVMATAHYVFGKIKTSSSMSVLGYVDATTNPCPDHDTKLLHV